MDDLSGKNNNREKSQFGVEVLIKQYEIYEIMARVFFNMLDRNRKIEALTLAAEEIRQNVLDNKQ